MRAAFFVFAILVTYAAFGSAVPSEEEQQFEHQGQRFIDGRFKTWDAIKNWFRPATQYVKEQLPHKTPAQLADDVKEAAIEFKDKAKEHPVVRTVGNAVRPVHQWVSQTANDLSKTKFVDIYDNVVGTVRRVDGTVAHWLNPNRKNEGRSEDMQVILH